MSLSASQFRRNRLVWYLYDVGNSAYPSVVLLAVYAAYFKQDVVGGAEGSRLWGLAVGIAMLVVAIVSPFLGSIADFSGAKKRFLLFFTTLSCLFTALLFFVQTGDVVIGMLFFILAEIGYRGGQVFYNALLPEVAEPDEVGRVSGIGWAIGLVGGIVCLLVVLGLIMAIEGTFIVRLSLVFTAIYFATFATPIFVWMRERTPPQPLPPGESYLSFALKRLKRTVRKVRHYREFLKFIAAFLVYNDGILMTLSFAAIFGQTVFGLEQQQIILFMLLVQVTSVIGAYVAGFMADYFDGRRTLIFFLTIMTLAVGGLFLNNNVTVFYVIGGVAGGALSAIQSVSRGLVSVLSPPEQSAEFYGFFAVAGRTSSFIGPTIYGWLAVEAYEWFLAQGEAASFLGFEAYPAGEVLAEQLGQRVGVLSIIIFLVVGLILLFSVDEERAKAALRSHPAA